VRLEGRRAGPGLIVHDDWRVREIVQLVLEEYGFSVTTVGDGATAITLIGQERPVRPGAGSDPTGADGFAVAEAERKGLRGVPMSLALLGLADGSQRRHRA
jgi:CheY-like chemotaxis protein